MPLPDQNAKAAYRRALQRAGQDVTVQRWTGQAPNRTVTQATVKAFVQKDMADFRAVARTDYSSSKQGAITQSDIHVVLLTDDISDRGFPLPVQKDDKVVVQGETFNVDIVDANTRIFAGAIDLTVTGV